METFEFGPHWVNVESTPDMLYILFVNVALWLPEILFLRSHDSTAKVLEVVIAVVQGPRHLHFERLTGEKAEEGGHGNCFEAVLDGR